MNWAILELYCGESGKLGYYNSQELGLARALSRRNINVTIVYPVKGLEQMEIQEVETGISVLRVPCRSFGVHAFYELTFLLDRKIDVVHLDSDNQMYAPSVMKFCKKNGIFFYSYVGTIYSDTKNFLKKQLMRAVSRRNIRYFRETIVAAKTDTLRKELLDNGVRNVRLVPVGLDTTQICESGKSKKEIRSDLSFPENKKILLFVGRLEQYKRPFAALELLRKLGKEYCLIVIGNGSLKPAFQNEIQKPDIAADVFYYEKIPNSEMYQYYCACDYFVNFNDHEIFGMSILEAMYQKCIVVARKAPGPEEIIEDGISGFLCSTDEEMANVIRNGAENDMGLCAKERVVSHFTWEKSADLLIKIVEDKNTYD